MNAKSRLFVKCADCVIEMNTTFAKEMRNPLSEEYALLQRTRLDFPTFAVRTRQIKSNPHKDTYKGLTYEYMEHYIGTHEPDNQVDEVLAHFEELKLISQCHGKRLRYPTIKKWFLNRYPDVAQFGMEPVVADEKPATQSAIPFTPDAADSEAA